MKQKFLVCLTMVLLLAIGLFGTALAEAGTVVPEVNVVLSQNRFTGPAPVDVTVTVSNPADIDMPGPCALYDPNGMRIMDFGQPTLTAGGSQTWSGTWNVSERELEEGRLVFTLGYTMPGADGVLIKKEQPFSVSIVNAGAEARLDVQRTITPGVARNGQKVYVTYVIQNVGGADVTDVTLKESSAVASSSVKLGALKRGASVTHTFTVTMGKKNLSSNGVVTYKANGESSTVSVGEAVIKYSDVKLTAALKADKKGGPAGDVVKLTLTLKNNGKSDIGNITVTDPILGTVFSGLTVEAGGTLTQEKELTITGTADHIFTVSGTNASGDVIATATEMVHVIAVDPARAVTLSVSAEVDKPTIYMVPGIVKFTVHVTNTGAVEATGVSVSASGVKIYPYDTSATATIAAGETLTFVRDVRVDYPGKFRFDATTAGQLGETLTFSSNEVPVVYAAPTAVPTLVPIATPAVPTMEELPTDDGLPEYLDLASQALTIGSWVMLGLSALCLVLIIVGLVGRGASKAKSDNAADCLERSSSNDYTQAVPNRRRRYMPESEPDEDEQDGHVYMAEEPTDVPEPVVTDPDEETSMQDAMAELYPEAAQEEASADATSELPPEDEQQATYFRRRRNTQDE